MSMKFKRYMSNAFLNMQNIALYVSDSSAELRYEWHGGVEAVRQFESAEAAELWYSALPGAGLDRLVNAIDAIRGFSVNIEGFIAQYPDAEEIESTRRWSRWVSGDYDDYGHATDDCTFCQFCGEEWEDFVALTQAANMGHLTKRKRQRKRRRINLSPLRPPEIGWPILISF